MRIVLWELLVALLAYAGPEGDISFTAAWTETGFAVDGTAGLPDGATLDVSLELDGATLLWAEAEVQNGRFSASVPLYPGVRPAAYRVHVSFAPDRQDDAAASKLPARTASRDLERGTVLAAVAPRAEAAHAVEDVLAQYRAALARAKAGAESASGLARELRELDGAARASCAVAWPYLPRSRGGIDRLRGWAHGAQADAPPAALAAFIAGGRRLLDEAERTLGDEREGKRGAAENAARPEPPSGESFGAVVAQALKDAQAEAEVEKMDAYGLGLSRGGAGAVAQIAPLLQAEPVVARDAARCLGWIPCPEATKALLDRVNADDPEMRAEVMRSLARLGAAESGALAEHGLTDSNPAIRAGAVAAILLLGGESRVPLLFPLCADPDGEVREAARDAVRRLAGEWPADAAEAGLVDRLKGWWIERSGRP